MKIEIFDVDHGQCAVITSPNNRRLMIDCGERWIGNRWWAPSMRYCSQYIDALALQNLDEDHNSNFPLLTQYVRIGQIITNQSVGASQLQSMKSQGMNKGVRGVHSWLSQPKATVPLVDFGPVRISWFHNPYIPGFCDDTNNLSVVLFVQYGGFQICFGGDMEDKGWKQLMAFHPEVLSELRRTCVYVASHHGRESGCCDELFDHMRPEIVIMSDGQRKYGTQDTDDWYRARCSGATVVAEPWRRRYVVTTRSDGSLAIDVNPNGSWLLKPVDVNDWDTTPKPKPAPNIDELIKSLQRPSGIADYSNIANMLGLPRPTGGISDGGSILNLINSGSFGSGIAAHNELADIFRSK